MNNSIIKYALNIETGKPVLIDEAERKLFYKCANCGNQMVVVKGEQRKKEWHFRHYEDTNCNGGQETVIHKLAKQIIVENSEILIPNEKLSYSQAREEEPFLSIVPDVIVVANNENIYFEIAVTNPVNISKESFYKNGKYKSIEIDLSNISYDIRLDDLKVLVLNQESNKRKIFWAEESNNKKNSSDNYLLAILLGIGTFVLGFFIFGRKSKSKKRF